MRLGFQMLHFTIATKPQNQGKIFLQWKTFNLANTASNCHASPLLGIYLNPFLCFLSGGFTPDKVTIPYLVWTLPLCNRDFGGKGKQRTWASSSQKMQVESLLG
jgi:hypothetical protein